MYSTMSKQNKNYNSCVMQVHSTTYVVTHSLLLWCELLLSQFQYCPSTQHESPCHALLSLSKLGILAHMQSLG